MGIGIGLPHAARQNFSLEHNNRALPHALPSVPYSLCATLHTVAIRLSVPILRICSIFLASSFES